MKINGPGQPPVAGVPGQGSPDGPADAVEASRAPGSAGAAPADRTQKSGKSFAETVAGAAPARPAGASALDRPAAVAVHDLAEALRAGRLEGRQAVDKVIDRVVAAQLGPDAPTHVRDKVQAALRDAVEDDPLLAEKLRGL
jgi:hypothetical protein